MSQLKLGQCSILVLGLVLLSAQLVVVEGFTPDAIFVGVAIFGYIAFIAIRHKLHIRSKIVTQTHPKQFEAAAAGANKDCLPSWHSCTPTSPSYTEVGLLATNVHSTPARIINFTNGTSSAILPPVT